MLHHSDVIIGAMASQITNVSVVYSTVYSVTDQRKYQGHALLAFAGGGVGGSTGDRLFPHTRSQQRGK